MGEAGRTGAQARLGGAAQRLRQSFSGLPSRETGALGKNCYRWRFSRDGEGARVRPFPER